MTNQEAIDLLNQEEVPMVLNGKINESLVVAHIKAIQALEEKQKNRWIPVSERLPEAEQEVELSVKRITDFGTYHFTVRGFYEDGNVWNEDSFCCWEYEKNVHELDEEKNDFKIPEGWWELSTYADEYCIHLIDDYVMAWRELPEPYKEGETNE
ncbi:DUF551 domain-containing protein [Anaerosacchariphilus polymeriproducens]|uniref:DUF551 domain-containing protein n=1 Tax=Anaerosacchariphilus polymeriproducens TaxID=1812858 RepID=A0A371ATK5_9FIRM|nr:DUF551 domain-containing protein [Anaerosacchariphilus polymeriproducens]RDU22872.1 DUF551 domain-containing protein [Anaerosacchariphilus polymeriproducens]